jgi:hypothetical protein
MGDDRDPVEERWETVAAFTSPIEARIALGALASAGIDAELRDEATVGVAWHLSNALGGVRLQVKTSQLHAARDVLAQQAPTDEHAEGAEDLRVSERDQLARRAVASAVIGFFVLPFVAHIYSTVLLARIPRAGGTLSPLGARHRAVAILFNVLALLLLGVLVTLFVRMGG